MKERLQKIIARAGITSRRKAEDLILSGRVTVNGQFIEELGTKADPGIDHIKVDGKLILPQPKEYIAFNKPRAVLSASSDPQGRKVVVDYVPSKQRLYPAGRLDFNSEGLLILTNDGVMARRIMEAGKHEKVYRVKVTGSPSTESLDRLRAGVHVGREVLSAHKIRPLKTGNNCWFEVVLRQGRNRQIRRMFEQVGHSVMRLRRTSIGPVKLGQLKPGHYRKLTAREVALLSQDRTGKRRSRTKG
jgi:23S rRNA pseudouridine2605 synthase